MIRFYHKLVVKGCGKVFRRLGNVERTLGLIVAYTGNGKGTVAVDGEFVMPPRAEESERVMVFRRGDILNVLCKIYLIGSKLPPCAGGLKLNHEPVNVPRVSGTSGKIKDIVAEAVAVLREKTSDCCEAFGKFRVGLLFARREVGLNSRYILCIFCLDHKIRVVLCFAFGFGFRKINSTLVFLFGIKPLHFCIPYYGQRTVIVSSHYRIAKP